MDTNPFKKFNNEESAVSMFLYKFENYPMFGILEYPYELPEQFNVNNSILF